jgi:hypothetical protein
MADEHFTDAMGRPRRISDDAGGYAQNCADPRERTNAILHRVGGDAGFGDRRSLQAPGRGR